MPILDGKPLAQVGSWLGLDDARILIAGSGAIGGAIAAGFAALGAHRHCRQRRGPGCPSRGRS